MKDTNGPKKPEVSGMVGVSAKFEHGAEAATAAPPSSASVPDNQLTALGEQWKEAYDNWQTSMPPRSDSEEWTPQDDDRSMQLARTTWGLEDQISQLPVVSLDDALVKIRIAGAYTVEHFGDRHAELTRQARDGLEHLVAASAIPAASDDEFETLERRMLALDATCARLDREGAPDEEKAPVHEEWQKLQSRLGRTPATTLPGLAVKLRLLANENQKYPIVDFEEAVIQSALECAERMTQAGVTTTEPPPLTGDINRLKRAFSDLEGASNALNNFAQSAELSTDIDTIGLLWLSDQIDGYISDLRGNLDALRMVGAEAVEQVPIAGDMKGARS